MCDRPRRREEKGQTRQRAPLGNAAALVAHLGQAADPRQDRALVAAAVSVVHGVPLLRVLAIRPSGVVVRRGEATLWPGPRQVVLVGALADAFGRFAAGRGPYAFPGRSALQPLTRDAVGHHLRALGLRTVAAQMRQPSVRRAGRERC